MLSIMLLPLARINSKWHRRLKSIWIKSSMGAGMLLLAETLGWMSLMNKELFFKLQKVHFKSSFIDALIDQYIFV